MSKIKNVGLDQYGAEPFEQWHSGTADAERVKFMVVKSNVLISLTPKHAYQFTS